MLIAARRCVLRRHGTVTARRAASSGGTPAAAAVLEEWVRRRQAVDSGQSDLLARLLGQPHADASTVFANTDVHLRDCDVVGFDFDYTICGYTEALHELIYTSALRSLIDKQQYPPELGIMRYDPTFPCRGVFFEPEHGNLLKLDATNRIEVATFGRKPLSQRTIHRLYHGGHVRHDHVRSMRMMADLFCFAEICLVADVISWLASTKVSFVPAYVYEDVKTAVADVHRSGLLYSTILTDPGRYVEPPHSLVQYFGRLRAAGKRTFLLTNSPFSYVDGVMRHLLAAGSDRGSSRDAGDRQVSSAQGWTSLFDLVVCSADKPHFFASDRPFRRMDPRSGRVDWAPIAAWPPPDLFEGGNVLLHGNLGALVRLTGYERVLYLGDHVESDMRDPRRLGWRTAMILSELAHDVHAKNSDAYRAKLALLLEAKDFLGNLFSCRPHLAAADKEAVHAAVAADMEALRADLRAQCGSRFGSPFSCDSQSSLFGLRMHRWADLYTSRLDNLHRLPVDAYLSPRSTTTTLPHEVRVMA